MWLNVVAVYFLVTVRIDVSAGLEEQGTNTAKLT